MTTHVTKVIQSCLTLVQLKTAETYAKLAKVDATEVIECKRRQLEAGCAERGRVNKDMNDRLNDWCRN